MRKELIFIVLMLGMLGCKSSADEVQVPTTLPPAVHTVVHTVEVTREVERLVTEIVVQTRIVTATFAGPTFTPTVTHTPQPTNTPKPTVDATRTDKKPGTYLIGSQIAPGNWRSLGIGDGCYWKVSDNKGEIIKNYFGPAGTVMYIPASGYVVQLDRECGNWTYLDK